MFLFPQQDNISSFTSLFMFAIQSAYSDTNDTFLEGCLSWTYVAVLWLQLGSAEAFKL